MRSAIAWAPWLLLLVACGSSQAAPPPGPSSPGPPSGPALSGAPPVSPPAARVEPPPVAPSGAEPYELHEWGVVDVASGAGTEIAAGPGAPVRPQAVRKPVVYAHLLDGASEVSFSLHVALAAGSIVEHWPPGAVSGSFLDWSSVVARAPHCALGAARRDRAAPACAAADGICEVAELPTYEAASSACLTVGAETGPLLFYRGAASSLRLPVEARRRDDMTAVVTATGSLAGAPGAVWRLSTAMSGPWPVGHVVVSRAPLPGPGQSVELPVGTQAVGPAERAALGAALAELGLDAEESEAFLRAWGPELLGAAGRGVRGPVRQADPGFLRWQDIVLVWLPLSACDSISTLDARPPPRAVRRAFLLRIDLGGAVTG